MIKIEDDVLLARLFWTIP